MPAEVLTKADLQPIIQRLALIEASMPGRVKAAEAERMIKRIEQLEKENAELREALKYGDFRDLKYLEKRYQVTADTLRDHIKAAKCRFIDERNPYNEHYARHRTGSPRLYEVREWYVRKRFKER